jgi:hypothetical protein
MPLLRMAATMGDGMAHGDRTPNERRKQSGMQSSVPISNIH